MRRRVKITGIGPVTPAGIGREAFFKGINEPVSRVRKIDRFDKKAGAFVGAEINDFSLRAYAPKEVPRRLARHTQFAIAAAKLAVEDAGLELGDIAKLNPAIISGSTLMDCEGIEKTYDQVSRFGPMFALANSIITGLSIAVPDKIAQVLEVNARILSLQTACCSGVDAIGQGVELIATGQADLAICGGTEAPLYYHPMLELGMLGLSPRSDEEPQKICRPFDLWRTTGVIGEGACMVVLEPEESPRPAYAIISGYGHAHHKEDEIGASWRESMAMALSNAKMTKEMIDYICAWGPGHKTVDLIETRMLGRIFRERLAEIPVSSIKGSIGSPLAAAGPIQVASACLSIRHDLIPPTVNWNTPDPDCALNLSTSPRRIRVRRCLINGHAISGNSANLVLESP